MIACIVCRNQLVACIACRNQLVACIVCRNQLVAWERETERLIKAQIQKPCKHLIKRDQITSGLAQ